MKQAFLQMLAATIIQLSIVSASAFAATSPEEGGGVAGNVWRLGAGMRASGMGQAFVAVPGDVWNLSANAAGLALMQHSTVSAEAQPMAMDRTMAAVAGGLKLPQNAGGVALSWRNAQVTNNMGRDSSANPTSYITDSDNLFSLGMGRSFGDVFSLGITMNAKYHILAGHSATGFSADLGMLLGDPSLCFAGTIHNIVDRQRWDTQDYDPAGKLEKAPGVFIVGAAGTPWEFLLLSTQYETALGQIDKIRAGMEWHVDEPVWVRAGYDAGELAVGGRVEIHSLFDSRLALDYLFRTDSIGGDPTQGLGLTLYFK
jgi:hypothetical protein